MDVEKAHALVKALADGTDPTTGEVLQDRHVCQQPDMVRALALAAQILEREVRRERGLQRARLTLPHNTGKGWSLEEDQLLLSRHRTGSTIAELARLHGRTDRAIAARLEKLGLTQPAARVPDGADGRAPDGARTATALSAEPPGWRRKLSS